MPAARKLPPKPPQVRLRPFLVRRGGHGNDVIVPRVERRGHPPDRAPLPRRVISLEENDERLVPERRVAREEIQAPLVLLEIGFVLGLSDLRAEIQRIQEMQIVGSREGSRLHRDGSVYGFRYLGE